MDHEDILCTAVAEHDETGIVSARCRLPLPLDLSQSVYELLTAHVACRPTWLRIRELFLISIGLEEDDYDKLVFADLPEADREASLHKLQEQLLEKFGSQNPKARLNSQKDGWVLKIQANSTVILSRGLADLLGLKEKLVNTSKTQRSFVVNFTPPTIPISEGYLLLTCENIRMNFCNPVGDRLRVADFLSLTDGDPTKLTELNSSSRQNFNRLEGGVVSDIQFILTDLSGTPIVADGVHFIVAFTIRHRAKNQPAKISNFF